MRFEDLHKFVTVYPQGNEPVQADLKKEMDAYGNDRWELVEMHPIPGGTTGATFLLMFKRPVQ